MVEWRWLGTAVALAAIWLAVLFVGVFGGDIVAETSVVGPGAGTRTAVPVVVVVAPLAVIATFFVSWFAYRSEKARATLRADRVPESVREAPRDTPFAAGRG